MEMVRKIILFSGIIFMSACSRELHTGRYIIDEVRGLNTVTFKGVKGDYHFPDPVKPGDTVYLKRVYKESKANVW
jgi:acyl dehydratase